MIKILVCLFTFGFVGCGSDVKEERVVRKEPHGKPAPRPRPRPGPGTGDPVSFRDVKPIIDKHCALSGCHAGAGFVANGPAFKASSSLARISSDSMPLRSSPNYGSYGANEKNKLMGFLTD